MVSAIRPKDEVNVELSHSTAELTGIVKHGNGVQEIQGHFLVS
jgi:hypothetical protein